LKNQNKTLTEKITSTTSPTDATTIVLSSTVSKGTERLTSGAHESSDVQIYQLREENGQLLVELETMKVKLEASSTISRSLPLPTPEELSNVINSTNSTTTSSAMLSTITSICTQTDPDPTATSTAAISNHREIDEDSESTISILSTQIETLTASLNSSKRQKDDLDKRIVSLMASKVVMEKESRKSQEVIKEQEAKVANLEGRLKKVEGELGDVKGRCEVLESELVAERERKEDIERDGEALRGCLEDKEELFQNLKGELEGIRIAKVEVDGKLKASEERAGKMLREMKLARDVHETEMVKLKMEHVQALEMSHASRESIQKDFQIKLEDAEARFVDLQMTYKETVSLVETLKRDMEKVNSEREVLQSTCTERSSLLESHQRESESLKESRETLMKEFEDLKSANTQLNFLLEARTDILNETDIKCQELWKRISDLTAEKKSIEETLNERNVQMVKLKQQIVDLESTHSALRSNSEESQRELQYQHSETSNKLQQLQSQLSSLESQNSKLETENLHLQTESSNLQATLTRVQSLAEEASKRMQSLEKRVLEFQDSEKRLKITIETLERETMLKSEVVTQLQARLAAVETMHQSESAKSEKSETELTSLRTLMKDARGALESLKTEHARVQESLKADKRVMEEKWRSEKCEMEESHRVFTDLLKAVHADEIEKMKTQLKMRFEEEKEAVMKKVEADTMKVVGEERDQQVSSLQMSVERFKFEVKALQDTVSKLEVRNKELEVEVERLENDKRNIQDVRRAVYGGLVGIRGEDEMMRSREVEVDGEMDGQSPSPIFPPDFDEEESNAYNNSKKSASKNPHHQQDMMVLKKQVERLTLALLDEQKRASILEKAMADLVILSNSSTSNSDSSSSHSGASFNAGDFQYQTQISDLQQRILNVGKLLLEAENRSRDLFDISNGLREEKESLAAEVSTLKQRLLKLESQITSSATSTTVSSNNNNNNNNNEYLDELEQLLQASQQREQQTKLKLETHSKELRKLQMEREQDKSNFESEVSQLEGKLGDVMKRNLELVRRLSVVGV
jgi:chromosome segregation ATPase